LCGVIGHPIGHSLSPVIHTAALEHDGRDAEYVAMDAVDLRAELERLRSLDAVGVNVTIPHKRTAWEVASRRSHEAESIGAANTLLFEAGESLAAHNTDPVGVIGGLRDLGVEPSGLPCLVVGAGGSGRAAVWALASAGASRVMVANRTAGRAEGVGGEIVEWEHLDDALGEAEVVVHATSVGLAGEETFLQVSVLSPMKCRAVLDLVYGRDETDLVRKVGRLGIPTADGLGALVHQAAAAYELFWDAPAPFEVMMRAAFRATGRRWH